MGTREDLLEKVAAARRRRTDAGRELDEANAALQAFEASERAARPDDDGAGDEVLHPPIRRVTVKG